MGVDYVPLPPLSADEVARLLAPLTQREREVLALRFGFDGNVGPRSHEEVATAFGITRKAVEKTEKSALRKLADTPYFRGHLRVPVPSKNLTKRIENDTEANSRESLGADFQVEFDGYMYS